MHSSMINWMILKDRIIMYLKVILMTIELLYFEEDHVKIKSSKDEENYSSY
jgi:hypothetical protein